MDLNELLAVNIGGFTVAKLCSAVITAVVCLVVIKILLMLADHALDRAKPEPTLKNLIRTALKVLLLFVGVIIVMGCLDIPVTSLVAVLSVVGLALSLAVQNFLSNVAGGLQILASKPFKVGDFVEAGGCSGTVSEIGLFYTKLLTPDSKLTQLPNSTIVSANVINYSSQTNRRVDLTVSVSYNTSIDAVKQVLTRLVGEHPLTLATPEPMIRVNKYGDNAIEYVIRVWCANADYWTVYFDLLDSIKPAFDQAGVEMTYPHMNVHMVQQ